VLGVLLVLYVSSYSLYCARCSPRESWKASWWREWKTCSVRQTERRWLYSWTTSTHQWERLGVIRPAAKLFDNWLSWKGSTRDRNLAISATFSTHRWATDHLYMHVYISRPIVQDTFRFTLITLLNSSAFSRDEEQFMWFFWIDF